jgi:hypothetical protein
MYYKQHGGAPETDHYGNCQQFIDECLQILNLGSCYTQFPPPLVNYIKKLRRDGYGEMEFELESSFKSKFFPETKPENLNSEDGKKILPNISHIFKSHHLQVFMSYTRRSLVSFSKHMMNLIVLWGISW